MGETAVNLFAVSFVPAILCAKGGFYFSAAKFYDSRNDEDITALKMLEDSAVRSIKFTVLSGVFGFFWIVSIPGLIIYAIRTTTDTTNADTLSDDEELD